MPVVSEQEEIPYVSLLLSIKGPWRLFTCAFCCSVTITQHLRNWMVWEFWALWQFDQSVSLDVDQFLILVIHRHYFFTLLILYWSMVDWQCSDSFISGGQKRDSAIHTHVSILPQTPLSSRLPHNIEQSSLIHWLSTKVTGRCLTKRKFPECTMLGWSGRSRLSKTKGGLGRVTLSHLW